MWKWHSHTMKTVPKEKRGILSGFLQSGFNFGFVIASVVFFGAVSLFPEDDLLKLDVGLCFYRQITGLVALFVRFRMNESQVAYKTKTQKN